MGTAYTRKPGGGSYLRAPGSLADYLRQPEVITGAGSVGFGIGINGVGAAEGMFVSAHQARGGSAARPIPRKLPPRREKPEEAKPQRRKKPKPIPEPIAAGYGGIAIAGPSFAGTGMLVLEGRGVMQACPSLEGHGMAEDEDWLIFGDIGLAA